MDDDDKPYFEALLLLSGFEVERMHKLANKYWPENEHYADIRRRHPWWLVQLKSGDIFEIGWRKRVISVNWETTRVRKVLTTDDVSKDETYVHAWGYVKALEYLSALQHAFDVLRAADEAAKSMASPKQV